MPDSIAPVPPERSPDPSVLAKQLRACVARSAHKSEMLRVLDLLDEALADGNRKALGLASTRVALGSPELSPQERGVSLPVEPKALKAGMRCRIVDAEASALPECFQGLTCTIARLLPPLKDEPRAWSIEVDLDGIDYDDDDDDVNDWYAKDESLEPLPAEPDAVAIEAAGGALRLCHCPRANMSGHVLHQRDCSYAPKESASPDASAPARPHAPLDSAQAQPGGADLSPERARQLLAAVQSAALALDALAAQLRAVSTERKP